jgi:hypothetical protein
MSDDVSKHEANIMKFVLWLESWVSDSLNFIIFGGIVWIGLLVSWAVVFPAAVYGMDMWWNNYSVLNPHVNIESTAAYWEFMIALFIIKVVFFFQSLYMVALIVLYCVRDKDFDKKRKEELSEKFKTINDHTRSEPPVKQKPKYLVDPDTPRCPECHKFDKVIKKGERDGKQRYFCKRDELYFQNQSK